MSHVHRPNNVLLVILDSTRAKNTSLHGHDRETTPFLESFTSQSTVYRQARAPSIHSIASHVSMFTGAHVEEHGAKRHTAQIDTSETIWAELRTEHGYATGLFTNNRIVADASNLGDSFEFVHDPDYPLAQRLEDTFDHPVFDALYFRWYDTVSRVGTWSSNAVARSSTLSRVAGGLSRATSALADRLPGGDGDDDPGYKSLHGSTFTDAFLDWEDRQDGPWAACINLMDTHSPYQPAADHDRWGDERAWEIQREDKPSIWDNLRGDGWDRIAALESLYDGTIHQADAIIADLVADLEERDLLEETLLVVTSDHGETFGETSRLLPDVRLRGHKWGIPEELTHVPLVVHYPGQSEGRVVDEAVSLTDTPDLLRSATDEADPATVDPLDTDGPVLSSTYRIPAAKIPKYGSIDDIETYVGPWRAVYESGEGSVRKYAQKGDAYVTLDVDADGTVDVVTREPHDRVRRAFDSMTDEDLLDAETAEIDEDLEQQLEDLGYVR